MLPQDASPHPLFSQALKELGVMCIHQTVLAGWVKAQELTEVLLAEVGHVSLGN